MGGLERSEREVRVRSACLDRHELVQRLRPFYREQVLFIPTRDRPVVDDVFAFQLGLQDDTILLRARGQRVDPAAHGLETGGYQGIAVELTEVDEAGRAFIAELKKRPGTIPFGIPSTALAPERVMCSVSCEVVEATSVPVETTLVATDDDEADAIEATLVVNGQELATIVEHDVEAPGQENAPTTIGPKPQPPDGTADDSEEATAVVVAEELAAMTPQPPVQVGASSADELRASLAKPTTEEATQSAKIPVSYQVPGASGEMAAIDSASSAPSPGQAPSGHSWPPVGAQRAQDSHPAPQPHPNRPPLVYVPSPPPPLNGLAGVGPPQHEPPHPLRAISATETLAFPPQRNKAVLMAALASATLGLGLGFLVWGTDGEESAASVANKTDDAVVVPAAEESDDTEEPAAEKEPGAESLATKSDAAEPDLEESNSDTPARVAAVIGDCTASLTTMREGAAIFVDGVLIGASPYVGPFPCEAKAIDFQQPGFLPQRIPAAVDGAGEASAQVTLERPRYRIRITSVPRRAIIKRDGKFVGRTPLVMRLPAFESSTLTVLKRGFQANKVDIRPVKNGGTRRVRLKRRRK